MKKYRISLYLASVFLLLNTSLLSASIETDFKQGFELYQAGDYSAAVAKFESARKQGLDSISLYFNLGSAYFKLGNYTESKRNYRKVLKSPDMRELAEFNLGLIAIKENDYKSARDYFLNIKNTGSDEKLVALSKNQLKKLDQLSDPFSLYLSSFIGYDDNITSTPTDSLTGDSGSFFDFYASAEALVSGEKKAGWLLNASYLNIDYSDSNDYDESQYSLGVKKTQVLGKWETSVHLSLTNGSYADEDYLSIYKVDVRGKRMLTNTRRFYLRYRLEDIASENSLYDYLDGWRQRLRAEFREYANDYLVQIYYELELNDRGQLVGTGYSYDYSPLRNTIRGKYARILDKNWQVSGDATLRYSDYPSSDSFDRDDTRIDFGLQSDYRVDTTLKLTARLQYSDSDSTEDIYDYDRTLIKIGLSKLF